MKPLVPVLAFVLITGAAAACASPGASPAGAQNLPYEGTVVSAIDVGGYVYIEVTAAGKTAWIAAPQSAPLKKGDRIEFADGTVMTDYYSKTLKKTFPTVMFVNKVVRVGASK